MGKRYYWLKMKEDLFDSLRIKKLRKIAGGDTYTIIYLKMQLKSLRKDGILKWTGVEDDFASELALDLDEDVENVKFTLMYLLQHDLAEMVSDHELYLPYVIENTGSETAEAQRVREFRQKKALEAASEDPENCQSVQEKRYIVTKMKRTCNVEKEIEKEKDIYINTYVQNPGDFATNDHAKTMQSTMQDHAEPCKCTMHDDANAMFEDAWKHYPKRRGKGQVSKSKKLALFKDVGLEQLIRCIERYKEYTKGWDMQYIMNGSTFFNSGYVDYLDANVEPVQGETKTAAQSNGRAVYIDDDGEELQ